MLDQIYLDEILRQTGSRLPNIKAAITLLEEGCTIPFIARYRSYMLGDLNESNLGLIQDRVNQFEKLHKKKLTAVRSLEERNLLSPELERGILAVLTESELDETLLPYKQKRKTLAQIAREKGLEPFSLKIQKARRGDQDPILSALRELGLKKIEILEGICEILAEDFSQANEIRKEVKNQLTRFGFLSSSLKKGANPGEAHTYRSYYDFSKPIRFLRPYQVLALLRGNREKILNLKFSLSREAQCFSRCLEIFGVRSNLLYFETISRALEIGFKKKLLPSIEREIKANLLEQAIEASLGTFGSNLKDLLLTRPLKGMIILGVDPGFKNGCKCALIDQFGGVLDTFTFYPVLDARRRLEALNVLVAKKKQYGFNLIAIGNGTACQETTQFISDSIDQLPGGKVSFMQVSEAGASIYSASPLAVEELGHLPIQVRGAVSIARRVQDPLAEYVKVPIESLGVGLYQHDMPKTRLNETLERVVQSSVSLVGVDINTASRELLTMIPGLSSRLATNMVKYRSSKAQGFQARSEILKVEGVGRAAYTQAAGFCRVPGSQEAFDETIVHPESYELAERILKIAGFSSRQLAEDGTRVRTCLNELQMSEVAQALKEPEHLVDHVFHCLRANANDPREELPLPLLREEILKLDSLEVGTELLGVIRNVVEFGLFIDVGVNVDGLLHRSQLRTRSPLLEDHYYVGQQLMVVVSEVDIARKRISLSEKISH